MCNFTTLQVYENVETAAALYGFIENVWGKLSAAITKPLNIQINLFLAGKVVMQVGQISRTRVILSLSY